MFSYAQAAKGGKAAQKEEEAQRGGAAKREQATQTGQAAQKGPDRSGRTEVGEGHNDIDKGKSRQKDGKNEQTLKKQQTHLKQKGADSRKPPERSVNKELTKGAIFLASHCEGAGDRVDNRPRTKRSPESNSTSTNPSKVGEGIETGETEQTDAVDGQGVTRCQGHIPIVIKDRKFIVLSVHHLHYSCIPLFTYKKEGAKGRVDRDDHVSVWDNRAMYSSRPFEQQSKWKRLETEQMLPSAHFLAHNTAARVTHPISRAKNVDIEYLGHLTQESTARLRDLYKILGDFVDSDDVKQQLIAKHTDPNWIEEEHTSPQAWSLGLRPRTSTQPSTPAGGRGQRTPDTRGSSNRPQPPRRLDFETLGRGRKDWAAKAAADAKAKQNEGGEAEDKEVTKQSEQTLPMRHRTGMYRPPAQPLVLRKATKPSNMNLDGASDDNDLILEHSRKRKKPIYDHNDDDDDEEEKETKATTRNQKATRPRRSQRKKMRTN